MANYRVGFDGRWQESFEDLDAALMWAREVGETGRLVHVVRRRLLWSDLVAVFPEEREQEGRRLWKVRATGVGLGGGKTW